MIADEAGGMWRGCDSLARWIGAGGSPSWALAVPHRTDAERSAMRTVGGGGGRGVGLVGWGVLRSRFPQVPLAPPAPPEIAGTVPGGLTAPSGVLWRVPDPLTPPRGVGHATCDIVLETYTIVGTTDLNEIYFLRGVNNGHPLAWVTIEGERRLFSVWMTGNGVMRTAEFRHAWADWVHLDERATPLNPGYEMFSATLVDDPTGAYVAWLERDSYPGGQFALCELRYDVWGTLSAPSIERNVYGPTSFPAIDPADDAGIKFLAGAAGVGGPVYVATQYDHGYPYETIPGTGATYSQADADLYAFAVTSAGLRQDLWFSVPGSVPRQGRASDPSVATSPSGRWTVFMWEERSGVGNTLLYYKLVDAAGVTTGPFVVRYAGAEIRGSDPCVGITENGVYVTCHVSSGSPAQGEILMLCLPLDGTLPSAATEWRAPDTNPAAWGGDRPEVLGPGWFPNLSVQHYPRQDVDVIAVTWDRTIEDPGSANKTTSVWVITCEPVSGPFTVVRRIDLVTEDHSSDSRLQLGGAVAVSPAGYGQDPIQPTLDIQWYEVTVRGPPDPGLYAELRHCSVLLSGLL